MITALTAIDKLEKQNSRKPSKRLTYIFLAIGLTILIIGFYLGVYTTTITVYYNNYPFGGPPTPHIELIQPYQPIGIFLIAIAALILIINIAATVTVTAIYQTYHNNRI